MSPPRPPAKPEPEEQPKAKPTAPARLRASAELPPGVPPGELYLLFSIDEFHVGTDSQGRAVAELAVPSKNWRAAENLRVLAGVKSGPASGDRVLVVEVNAS